MAQTNTCEEGEAISSEWGALTAQGVTSEAQNTWNTQTTLTARPLTESKSHSVQEQSYLPAHFMFPKRTTLPAVPDRTARETEIWSTRICGYFAQPGAALKHVRTLRDSGAKGERARLAAPTEPRQRHRLCAVLHMEGDHGNPVENISTISPARSTREREEPLPLPHLEGKILGT